MSIQMNFKKEDGSIKLESIKDDGTELDITGYTDKGLLTIGADGKYTGISAEPITTLLSNNEVNLNTQEENTETSNDLDSGSNELTTQKLDTPTGEETSANSMDPLEKACTDLELAPGCEKNNNYKRAFKKLALKYHPDTCADNLKPCEPMFQKINAAHIKLNEYNEPTNQPENTKPLAIEDQPKQSGRTLFSFANKIQENKSNLPRNAPVPSENNPLQVATISKGGKTKRRKAGKKNKSKRVRFMSRRNRRR